MSWGDNHPASTTPRRLNPPEVRSALVDGGIAALDGVTGRSGGRHGRESAAGQGIATIMMTNG